MITTETYLQFKHLSDAHNAWVDTKRGRNGWAAYKQEEVPAHLQRVTNEMRSAIEMFEFAHHKPDQLFAYVTGGKLGNWMGETMGRVQYGASWRDNFGGERVSIRVRASNGRTYAGTYYKSAGQYARLKAVKGN